jgi:hypothetical protein
MTAASFSLSAGSLRTDSLLRPDMSTITDLSKTLHGPRQKKKSAFAQKA